MNMPASEQPILVVDHLVTEFRIRGKWWPAVRDVSFSLARAFNNEMAMFFFRPFFARLFDCQLVAIQSADKFPAAGQIRNSNNPMITALAVNSVIFMFSGTNG